MMSRSFFLCFVVIAAMLVAGCGKSSTTLNTGMSMNHAVAEMKQRGLEPQQMAYVSVHQAFNLPDGRTVILFGEQSVEGIEVIPNPEEPKSKRTSKAVSAIEF